MQRFVPGWTLSSASLLFILMDRSWRRAGSLSALLDGTSASPQLSWRE